MPYILHFSSDRRHNTLLSLIHRLIPLLLPLIKLLLGSLRRIQTVTIRLELDDFAQEVVGLALPVGHGFAEVGVAGRVLQQAHR